MSNSRLYQILEEVMGPNVRRQLETVVPDFFDKGYVVMQMQPKPESEQSSGYAGYRCRRVPRSLSSSLLNRAVLVSCWCCIFFSLVSISSLSTERNSLPMY